MIASVIRGEEIYDEASDFIFSQFVYILLTIISAPLGELNKHGEAVQLCVLNRQLTCTFIWIAFMSVRCIY